MVIYYDIFFYIIIQRILRVLFFFDLLECKRENMNLILYIKLKSFGLVENSLKQV